MSRHAGCRPGSGRGKRSCPSPQTHPVTVTSDVDAAVGEHEDQPYGVPWTANWCSYTQIPGLVSWHLAAAAACCCCCLLLLPLAAAAACCCCRLLLLPLAAAAACCCCRWCLHLPWGPESRVHSLRSKVQGGQPPTYQNNENPAGIPLWIRPEWVSGQLRQLAMQE